MSVVETRVDEDEALHQLTLLYYLPEVEPWGNIVDQGLRRKRNNSFPFRTGSGWKMAQSRYIKSRWLSFSPGGKKIFIPITTSQLLHSLTEK